MANASLQLPATLPPGTYEQASGGRPPPGPTSPIARQHTGPQSPVRPQYTGGALQPQRTGQGVQAQPQATPPRQGSVGPAFAGASAFGQNRAGQQAWDVKPDAKATSDRFFAQLDQQNRGIIEGDVAVPFMLQSQLDEGSLATVWYVYVRGPKPRSRKLQADWQGPVRYPSRGQVRSGHVCCSNAPHQPEAWWKGSARQLAKLVDPACPTSRIWWRPAGSPGQRTKQYDTRLV